MRSKVTTAAGSLACFVLGAMLFLSGAWAADSAGEPGRGSGKPNPLNNLYFGEQHLEAPTGRSSLHN
jgi:hypothetical protein